MVTRNARLAAKAQAIAEAQAAKDAELMEALQKRSTEATQETSLVPPKASLGDNFVSVAAMLAQTKKNTRLQEATLIKAWEVILWWELNNRNQSQQQPAFDPQEMIGEFTETPEEATNE